MISSSKEHLTNSSGDRKDEQQPKAAQKRVVNINRRRRSQLVQLGQPCPVGQDNWIVRQLLHLDGRGGRPLSAEAVDRRLRQRDRQV